ncbi:hypothetical protein Hanom_Chr06g00536401 [Helianthus anomalus]
MIWEIRYPFGFIPFTFKLTKSPASTLNKIFMLSYIQQTLTIIDKKESTKTT